MTREETKSLQRRMNAFVKIYLEGLGPILVDGELGQSTQGRIRTIKWYLGYQVPKGSKGGSNSLDPTPDNDFRSRLWHPKSLLYSTPVRLARAASRRVAQRKRARENDQKAREHGVGHFDGRAVANWLIPYLQWGRDNGWRGTLVSGWRDPAYSESLCYRMCGRPSCPGKCAGRSSNHSGSDKAKGAVDVSDYIRFGQLMTHCPHSPHIFNNLPVDRVHFSATGR